MSHEKDARLYIGKIILHFSFVAILFVVPSTKEGHIFNNITEIDHPYCVYFEGTCSLSSSSQCDRLNKVASKHPMYGSIIRHSDELYFEELTLD